MTNETKKTHKLRNLLMFATTGIVLIFAIIFGSSYAVTLSALHRTYTDVNTIPHRHIGILLGTSKYTTGGGLNEYFSSRIRAAKELIDAKKIDYLVISGDNSTKNYNEPETMKQALLALGVDEHILILDYAGLDTYDSIVRMQRIFQQTEFTVISQEFHTTRALFIAEHKGLDAIAYTAKEVKGPSSGPLWIRETLARVKAVFDVLINRNPQYLGDTVTIPE